MPAARWRAGGAHRGTEATSGLGERQPRSSSPCSSVCGALSERGAERRGWPALVGSAARPPGRVHASVPTGRPGGAGACEPRSTCWEPSVPETSCSLASSCPSRPFASSWSHLCPLPLLRPCELGNMSCLELCLSRPHKRVGLTHGERCSSARHHVGQPVRGLLGRLVLDEPSCVRGAKAGGPAAEQTRGACYCCARGTCGVVQTHSCFIVCLSNFSRSPSSGSKQRAGSRA